MHDVCIYYFFIYIDSKLENKDSHSLTQTMEEGSNSVSSTLTGSKLVLVQDVTHILHAHGSAIPSISAKPLWFDKPTAAAGAIHTNLLGAPW